MILPTKHIAPDESLIGLGALLLPRLSNPRTVTSLWEQVRGLEPIGSFDRFALALDLLYCIGAIDWQNGKLQRLST